MNLLLIVIAIVALDQLTKWIAIHSLTNPIWFFHDVGFQLAYNKGVAFSMPLTGISAILVSLVIAILLLIFYVYKLKRTSLFAAITVGLIIGGAVGNAVDRIRMGHVIDFIHIGWWPAFNMADTCIVAGSLLLVLFYDKLKKE